MIFCLIMLLPSFCIVVLEANRSCPISVILAQIDKENQKMFDFYWDRSEHNNADYYTKHHSAKYHTETRPKYVHNKATSAFSLVRLARVC